MHRKTGPDTYYPPNENRFGNKSAPYRVSEKKASDLSTEQYLESKLHDRERDVYIKSRTFQNSNWRQQPQAWEKASHSDSTPQIKKKDMAAVNSFMPHFCVKKESNYTPTLKAVDNLTPKFLSMDLNSDGNAFQTRQPKKSPGSPNTRNNQNLGNNSWRKPSNTYSPTGLLNSVRNKFHDGSVLSAVERKIIAQPAALMQMLGSKTSLYETMNELHSITLKVQVDDFEREEQACEHVKQEMLSQYPNCSVALYGIRQLGMAHPKSAIYMFFNTGINYCQASNENKENQTRVRGTVYEVMKHCGHCEKVTNWDVQELVTFKHNDTEMNCVVSFTNGFKEQNTLLLKSYLKMDKRLRLLMLLVTDMVYRYHDISKYFTSYVLNIMVIMFLQRIPEPVLPTLFELRNMFPYKKVIIGGFDCGFPKETPCLQSSNHLSVENLLKGFCAFYKDFNFEDDVVSILGPELKRSMFCPPYNNTISDEPLNSYLLSLKNGGNTPKMNCDLPVIVQDPFELCCNAAEKVNMSVLEVFKMMCQDGFDILSKWC